MSVFARALRVGRASRAAFRWAFRAAARGLAVSGASARVIEERYGAPAVEVVPNAVEQVRTNPTSPPDPQAPPQILFLGGFANPVKGGSVLVEALPALRAACPRARIDLAGPGDPPPELATGDEEVCWLGWLDRGSTQAALAAADLFVLPSTSGGVPVALLEATAHGKRIVATRVGGVPEVLDHGHHALLVPPGDAPGLARALAELAWGRPGAGPGCRCPRACRRAGPPAHRRVPRCAFPRGGGETAADGARGHGGCAHGP